MVNNQKGLEGALLVGGLSGTHKSESGSTTLV